ncbi:MAG TPA: lytic transglycosylase domain-containing protein [Terriglobales bacterium]
MGSILAVLAVAIPASAADLAVLRNGYSIRHERRQVVGKVTRLFTGADPKSYIDVPTDQIERFEKDDSVPPPADPPVQAQTPPQPQVQPQVPAQPPVQMQPQSQVSQPQLQHQVSTARQVYPPPSIDKAVNDASDKHLLDADLINSVIHAESNFKTHAVSPKGAQGLMQLMPGTASKLGVSNAFDPAANVDAGTRYLRWLLERYNYDLAKALAAYNAGPGRVEQYRGIPPYYETRTYVARIIKEYNKKKLAQMKAEADAKKSTAKKAPSASQAKPTSAARSKSSVQQNKTAVAPATP